MKSRVTILIRLILALTASVNALAADSPASGRKADNSEEIVPLIVIDDVPLTDALKNVARQMELNYILDPRVPGSKFGPGRMAPEPAVNGRWTNVTIQVALTDILHKHRLTIVRNPATTVARIMPAYQTAMPVPASQVGTNTGAVIPVLTMEDVALSETIRKLAVAAQLHVVLDPNVRATATVDLLGLISFRWEKITARQALVALLDNYGLMLIEEPASASTRITFKTEADAAREREKRR
jgi:hypothetical protein